MTSLVLSAQCEHKEFSEGKMIPKRRERNTKGFFFLFVLVYMSQVGIVKWMLNIRWEVEMQVIISGWIFSWIYLAWNHKDVMQRDPRCFKDSPKCLGLISQWQPCCVQSPCLDRYWSCSSHVITICLDILRFPCNMVCGWPRNNSIVGCICPWLLANVRENWVLFRWVGCAW